MNVKLPDSRCAELASRSRSPWHPSIFFNPQRLAETIAFTPTLGPILVWALLSWWVHEPQWMSRLAVRFVDSHLYAVPTFLQGLLRHALPWLLGFALIALIFHYLYRDTEKPKLSLEARWLAVSSLWGIILCFAGTLRGLSELGNLTPNPIDTPVDALSNHPTLLALKIGCYGLGIGLVVWSSAHIEAAQVQAQASRGRLSTMALALGVVMGVSGASLTVQRDWSLIRPLQTSDLAPDFNLRNLERGDRVTLESWSESGGLTLIDFWATWCQPCLVAMPQIEAIHHDYHNDNVRVLSVNIERDDIQTVRKFLENNPMPFEVWIDDDRMAARYDVSLYPTFVLLEDKRVVGIYEGLPGLVGVKREIEAWVNRQRH